MHSSSFFIYYLESDQCFLPPKCDFVRQIFINCGKILEKNQHKREKTYLVSCLTGLYFLTGDDAEYPGEETILKKEEKEEREKWRGQERRGDQEKYVPFISSFIFRDYNIIHYSPLPFPPSKLSYIRLCDLFINHGLSFLLIFIVCQMYIYIHIYSYT